MNRWVILASGQSLTDEDVEYIRQARADGRVQGVIGVSNTVLDKCPWADALVSHDTAWWQAYPEALNFKAIKISRSGYRGTVRFQPDWKGGLNSGLLAMLAARDIFDATDLVILGFDMHGTHYFGAHTRKSGNVPLKNSNQKHFNIHIKQFDEFEGCNVVNCTPNSALKKFHMARLRDTI